MHAPGSAGTLDHHPENGEAKVVVQDIDSYETQETMARLRIPALGSPSDQGRFVPLSESWNNRSHQFKAHSIPRSHR